MEQSKSYPFEQQMTSMEKNKELGLHKVQGSYKNIQTHNYD